MNDAQKERGKNTLKKFDDEDAAIRAKAQAFNDLETFILENRPIFRDEDPFIRKTSSIKERENLVDLLNEAEEWLYDAEDGVTVDVILEKLKSIQSKVDPIRIRAYEYEHRDSKIKSIRSDVKDLKSDVEDIQRNK
eukprot:UN32145